MTPHSKRTYIPIKNTKTQKITTIGDAYVAAAGPSISRHTKEQATRAIVRMGRDMIKVAERINMMFDDKAAWNEFLSANTIKVRQREAQIALNSAMRNLTPADAKPGGRHDISAGPMFSPNCDSVYSDPDDLSYRDKVVAPRDRKLAIRVGVDNGVVFGGVLGQKQFVYQIWGPSLSKATRMESTGRRGAVSGLLLGRV
jgi:hypothetical protein